MDNFK
jgi:hypothetical protein